MQAVNPNSVVQKKGLRGQAKHSSQRGQAIVRAVERLQVREALGVGAESLQRLGLDLVLKGVHGAALDCVQGRRGAGHIG